MNAHKWICISNVSSFLDVCFFLRFFISWFCASFPVVDVYFLWCYLTAECHRNPHFHFLWMWVGSHGCISVSYGPLFLAARFFFRLCSFSRIRTFSVVDAHTLSVMLLTNWLLSQPALQFFFVRCWLVNTHRWIGFSYVPPLPAVRCFPVFSSSRFCTSFPLVGTDTPFLWPLHTSCHSNPHLHFL